jgi:hypothetical protein
MTDHMLSFADEYQRAGEDWADKEAAAQLLEDCKSATMAQWCVEQGDIPVNRAEQTVKSSPRWQKYVENTVEARRAANKAKVYLESIKMRAMEWHAKSANYRAEARIT